MFKSRERHSTADKDDGGENGRLYVQHFQMDSMNSYLFRSQIGDSH